MPTLLPLKKAEPLGFEPSFKSSEPAQDQLVAESSQSENTQIRAQMEGAWGRDLSRVVAVWSKISDPLKAAILAIVNSATAVSEDES